MKAYADHLGDTDPAQKNIAEKNLAHQLEQMRLARSLGVRIALGTDAGGLGVFHGAALAMEMELFLEAGLTVPETIRLATANGADLLGLNSIGSLTPGKEATFVVVKGGGKESIPDLKDIEAIYIKGRSRSISAAEIPV
jgi:imidazolonepropionase-like amidohydrolase